MRHLLFAAGIASSFLLAGCGVDTTGISASTSRTQHPSTGAQAVVTVTEFADLQCPACASAHTQIVKPLVEKYGTDIRFDFKHYPLRTLHRYALPAAEAAECAADQGKFWEYEDIAFTRQAEMNEDALQQWARDLGLDMELFGRCTASHIKRDTIMTDYEEGTEAGVQGTPTFFVNGQRVESDLATISAAIDAALQAPTQRL